MLIADARDALAGMRRYAGRRRKELPASYHGPTRLDFPSPARLVLGDTDAAHDDSRDAVAASCAGSYAPLMLADIDPCLAYFLADWARFRLSMADARQYSVAFVISAAERCRRRDGLGFSHSTKS